MQILSAKEIKAWDHFTIQNEPVSSIDLMERAAQKCVQWILHQQWTNEKFLIFCGKGNNGGDGLAIARMLIESGLHCTVYILEFGKLGSEEFQINLQRLHELNFTNVHFIQEGSALPFIEKEKIIIDALFGSGLNKALEGISSNLVEHINASEATIVSIDLPSGLYVDRSSEGNTIINASFTLSFQCYKLALLMQENAPFIGEVRILDIGLHPHFLDQLSTSPQLLDEVMIRKIFKPKNRFAHKGKYGHALVVGGSYGKMGAVVLATRACLNCGAGLTSVFIPRCGYHIMQTTAPEAMVIVDDDELVLTSLPDDIERFNAIGIGPGMGTKTETQKLISFIIRRCRKPLVIDADGLNCLALQKELLHQLPPYSILTPHPKEFDRLFGEHTNGFERMQKAKENAIALQIIIILKSHHTLIAMPDGACYFNSTGNAGMAKGGSGDVLTGMITSFLAQGYSPHGAALLAVYMHGWAGDFAAKKYSMQAMLPSHLIDCLSDVFCVME